MRKTALALAALSFVVIAALIGAPGLGKPIVDALDDAAGFYKIGLQLIFAGGLDLIPRIRERGKKELFGAEQRLKLAVGSGI